MKHQALVGMGIAMAAGVCIATEAQTPPKSTSKHPDLSGVWAQPDSEFLAAMARVAHGNGPDAPSYVPSFIAAQNSFGAGPGGPPPGAGAPGRTNEANAASCLPNGVPAVMGVPVGFEFLLTPGLLTILVEEGPTVRQVYMDGRKHSPDADPSYTGESIGHWEGQTLVVDTTAISSKAQFFFGIRTSGKTHLIERIHLVDKNHLRIDTEVDDPIALQKPWHYSWTYRRSNTDFTANICDRSSDRDRNGEPDLTPPPDAP